MLIDVLLQLEPFGSPNLNLNLSLSKFYQNITSSKTIYMSYTKVIMYNRSINI
jgi:hypothetical protein